MVVQFDSIAKRVIMIKQIVIVNPLAEMFLTGNLDEE